MEECKYAQHLENKVEICIQEFTMLSPTRTFYPVPLGSALSPQTSSFLSKQKTLVCFSKWAAHIPVQINVKLHNAGEHSKEEKVNSSTNAYLFPIFAPSHNTFVRASQHER